ncbi:hypothetical protein ACIBF5_19840, partial [Micromonospora sp. NPDC050417]|uniref:hypothetical protein n=1 Tax=Micromonospora sp. NPDC050417 TaxID=3364280 RepID=UPI00379E65AC
YEATGFTRRDAPALLRSYAMYNDPTPANIPPIMAPSMLIKPKNLAPKTAGTSGGHRSEGLR